MVFFQKNFEIRAKGLLICKYFLNFYFFLKTFDGLTILYITYTKKRSSKGLWRTRKIGKKTDHHLQSGGLILVSKNFSKNHPAGRSQAFWRLRSV